MNAALNNEEATNPDLSDKTSRQKTMAVPKGSTLQIDISALHYNRAFRHLLSSSLPTGFTDHVECWLLPVLQPGIGKTHTPSSLRGSFSQMRRETHFARSP